LKLVDKDKVIDGIDFIFSKRITTEKVEKPIPANNENSGFRPLNLKFPKSQYKLVMTDELKTYFDDLKQYLAEHKNAKVSIVGHTDNTGNRKDNMRISKYRVRKVRDYLVKQRISLKRIHIDYKGPDEPIASNDTEEGREKNRRVEIRVTE
ncbi:MAG TPA: OmpA family protein, partial [Saprospiraceae bacterium]|nr:OmpA family protein [Saprospiraceae bacterium]